MCYRLVCFSESLFKYAIAENKAPLPAVLTQSLKILISSLHLLQKFFNFFFHM